MVKHLGPSVKPCIFTRFNYSKEYLDKKRVASLGTLVEGASTVAGSFALAFVK